jgi:hypothetical protein
VTVGRGQLLIRRAGVRCTIRTSSGQAKILASYRCDEGVRQLVGQGINGTVVLSDIPVGDQGRVYLVERQLQSQAELDGLVADYLALAAELDRPPLWADWAARGLTGLCLRAGGVLQLCEISHKLGRSAGGRPLSKQSKAEEVWTCHDRPNKTGHRGREPATSRHSESGDCEEAGRHRGGPQWSSASPRSLERSSSPPRNQLAVAPDVDSLRTLARRVDETHAEPVCAVVESMTGARLVHDTSSRRAGTSRSPTPRRSRASRPWPARPTRRRFAPHQLRHAHAVEMAHEGVPLVVIQRQLGHGNLGITSVYLQGIDNAEILNTVPARRAPPDPGQHGTSALTDTRPPTLLVAQGQAPRGKRS